MSRDVAHCTKTDPAEEYPRTPSGKDHQIGGPSENPTGDFSTPPLSVAMKVMQEVRSRLNLSVFAIRFFYLQV